MKKENLYESMSSIDEDILSRSENSNKKKLVHTGIKYGAMAACLCIAVVAALVMKPMLQENGLIKEIQIATSSGVSGTTSLSAEVTMSSGASRTVSSSDEGITSSGASGTASSSAEGITSSSVSGTTSSSAKETMSSDAAVATRPKWDEMTISQQFSETEYGGNQYTTRVTKVPQDKITVKLSNAVLQGKDFYTGTTHEITAEIYGISGISNECAVALKFKGQSDYYVYVNSWYHPKTLGQFIKDLSLHDNLSVNSAGYEYQKDSGKYATAKFTGLDAEKVWELLLSDTSLEAIEDYDSHFFQNVMEISIDVPLLGYKNICMAVTDDGYLTTNILNTGKAFYIGTEKVQAFKQYVTDNCEENEIVYSNVEPG